MPTPNALIRTPAQVRAVSGPTQHRLLAGLERLGECAVTDLAAATGLAPESIYYHLRKFERVGILRRTGARPAARRDEALYQLNAPSVIFDSNNTTKAYRQALGKMVGALLRMATRAYETAVENGAARHSGRYRNTNMHQLFLRIPKSRLSEAHRRIDELFDDLQSFDDVREEQWLTVTLVSCPLEHPASVR